MAYVKTSRSRGKEYRQIVESYREDGKVKQRVLVHLPSDKRAETPEAAAELCEYLGSFARGTEQRCIERGDEDGAQESARRAEKYEAKARTIRDLIASGKIKPDPPGVRAERERRREEGRARSREISREIHARLQNQESSFFA
jgi:hypothetical protein